MKIIDSLAVRDTSDHLSMTSENLNGIVKTYIVENGLNQLVTIQVMASANEDFSNSFNVGSAFDIAATTNTFISCSCYFPYIKVKATCAVAPSSGVLSVFIFKFTGG